jgi:hypothetical protein
MGEHITSHSSCVKNAPTNSTNLPDVLIIYRKRFLEAELPEELQDSLEAELPEELQDSLASFKITSCSIFTALGRICSTLTALGRIFHANRRGIARRM